VCVRVCLFLATTIKLLLHFLVVRFDVSDPPWVGNQSL